jgi:Ricin-type beta-trefoil lectin domain-like/Bacterial TSP3 repeat
VILEKSNNMNRNNKISLMLVSLTLACNANALTYTLASDNASWPADKKAAVVAAMDEAVAIYNSYGYFNKSITAGYNAGVPTAEGNYNGTLTFGGMIGTRVALHEIGHTLGVGQYSTWISGGWTGAKANARIKLYDGQNGYIGSDSMHFWPYGLNQDSEDGPAARERHVKMVSALRYDMGIVVDSDNDGLPDDWEMFNFGNLNQTGTGDPDGDGITNADEYATDSNPNAAGAYPGRTYRFKAKFSGKYIEVPGASLTSGTALQQNTGSTSLGQRWTAYPTGGGWWKFVNVNSGLCLQTAGSSYDAGASIEQAAWTGSSYWQQWRLAYNSDGNWRICNRASGLVLDVYYADSSDGASIKQSGDWMGSNQLWSFEEQTPFPDSTVYSLMAMHSNKVLDVFYASTSSGGNVGQYPWNGGNNQKWRVVDIGSGWIRLVNVNSGLNLEVAGASTANGGNVQQWAGNGNFCQDWKAIGTDQTGVYQVVNRNSGLSLDVEAASTADLANVFQWSWWNGNNQKWKFDLR